MNVFVVIDSLEVGIIKGVFLSQEGAEACQESCGGKGGFDIEEMILQS